MGKLIAVLNKNGEDSTKTAITMLKSMQNNNAETYGIASFNTLKLAAKAESLDEQTFNSNVIIGYAFTKIVPSDKPQPIILQNTALIFDGRIYPQNKTASTAQNIAQNLNIDSEKKLEKTIKDANGDFAFVTATRSKLTAGRDATGLHPLYYGENGKWLALASERKALWKIGLQETRSFPPGTIASTTKQGFKLKHLKKLTYTEPDQTTMQTAARQLRTLLERSVKDRVSDSEKIAVAFSGGLDSTIIAHLAKQICKNVQLIHVSLENQPETDQARKTAQELALPIHVKTYTETDVAKTLREVLWLIEEDDPIKASIGIPVFWTAQNAAKLNNRILLAGQGADELFGGYKRYVTDFLSHDAEHARRTIFRDITTLHETNLERDFNICNHHNVELRLPFAAYEIAQFAANLPVNLKIEPKEDSSRKLILRKAARRLGLPESTTQKPKKAMQYATGVDKVLKKLAKKKRITTKEYVHGIFSELRRRSDSP